MKLLSDECPGAIREQELSNLTGRKIAIDASMAMYQFLIAVRTAERSGHASMLTNEAGEVTSHIQGMFNRTIKLLSAGVKPVYVFDGKPPGMKSDELAKRTAKRIQAESDLAAAKEADDAAEVDRFSRRLVKVTKQHNEDCKELLRLMGVPVINAPCEAEAQCAELAKKGRVYATATEDMDALTFRTPKLLRKMTFSAGNKQPILEIDVELVLAGLQLSYEQFVDLCILCGCDYCSSIKGIGPKTALKLMRLHGSIEGVVRALKKDKKVTLGPAWVPTPIVTTESSAESAAVTEAVAEVNEVQNDDEGEEQNDEEDEELDVSELLAVETTEEVFEEEASGAEMQPPLYLRARELFLQSEVTPAEEVELKWSVPDEGALKEFLVTKMGFNEERVVSGIKKLVEAQGKKAQQRMDSFFKPLPSANSAASLKRKATEVNGKNSKNGANKAAKSGNFKKR